MRRVFIFACALVVASCETTKAEWEAFYRAECIARFDELSPGEPVTEEEISVCMEFRRSGLTWGFDWLDGDDNDRNNQ
ncbi:MAG: hypothetical protein HOB79_06175 [Rhodospirillaceae bacterium]|jgi:hypothetical protein|nr:hypothetical protein [Rhodospirillales bacterium]MBT3907234.1 hypothetical protein [Rhodospirillaceae bacterium]MBT4700646.1 hypothetical protein [Rhodospirillaceae bacterium]MBT5036190.1 hypothetical protein [Rhodospirillaceae bacterium]MBT6218605.1 hypothetical protein [Rhodospirillaceae bacterium]